MALNNIIRSTCMTCVLAHLFHKNESAIKNNVTIVLISAIYSVVSGEGPLPLLGHNKSGSLDSKIWILATIKKNDKILCSGFKSYDVKSWHESY